MVVLDDLPTDGQAESGALLVALRGEERLEDATEVARRDPRPIVADGDDDPLGADAEVGGHGERPAPARLAHGLHRVEQQVDEHLLELVGVGHDRRELGREVAHHGDVGAPELVDLQLQRLFDEAVDVHGRATRRLLAGEAEERADDLHRALGLPADSAQSLGDAGVHTLALEEVGGADDDGQGVVQLMGDARHDPSDGGEPLGVDELLDETAGLHGDRRLVREPREQPPVVLVEPPALRRGDRQHPHHPVPGQQGHTQVGPEPATGQLRARGRILAALVLEVGDMDRRPASGHEPAQALAHPHPRGHADLRPGARRHRHRKLVTVEQVTGGPGRPDEPHRLAHDHLEKLFAGPVARQPVAELQDGGEPVALPRRLRVALGVVDGNHGVVGQRTEALPVRDGERAPRGRTRQEDAEEPVPEPEGRHQARPDLRERRRHTRP